MMRLSLVVYDLNSRLHRSLDDHRYNPQRYPEAVQEEGFRWRRLWAHRVRHKLTRKPFFGTIDEDDIHPPSRLDRSTNKLFTVHDQFEIITECLCSWRYTTPIRSMS